MRNKFTLLLAAAGFIGLGVFFAACEKDYAAPASAPAAPAASASFVEEFNNVGDLAAKGWAIKNNSNPVGGTAWRQGRYETSTKYPVDFIGFPAYSAKNSPTDFISCDVSAVGLSGNINAWLISPQMTIKNGDVISFYTRAVDDGAYFFCLTDRLQLRANFTDGTTNVGSGDTTVGSFKTILLNINPNALFNDPACNATGAGAGYPRVWTKYTATVSGLSAPVQNARLAFRYHGLAAGVNDANSAGVVGIDQLTFQSN